MKAKISKAWVKQGEHLWAKDSVQLFLQGWTKKEYTNAWLRRRRIALEEFGRSEMTIKDSSVVVGVLRAWRKEARLIPMAETINKLDALDRTQEWI